MSEEGGRRRLGRGLSALLGEGEAGPAAEPGSRGERFVPVESLRPNRFNPRRQFGEEALSELADSIRERGIVQPIVVRETAGGGFEIIAGERRWRAAQRAGVHEVPVVVRAVDDRAALEFAIVENVQRTDLTPLEEAGGYRRLLDEFGYRQEDLAKVIGKSRSHVSNTLRLLNLPESCQALLASGAISAGHGRALLASDDPEGLARRIVDGKLSVRAAEAAAQDAPARERRDRAERRPRERDADTLALEKRLSDHLGLAVRIDHRPDGSGAITVSYRTLEQLDDVCRRLGG